MTILPVLLLSGFVAAQGTGRPVILNLASHIEPRNCSVNWRLYALFAGLSDRAQFDPDTRSLEIATVAGGATLAGGAYGQPLKVLVSCRGYEAAFYDFPVLDASTPGEIDVAPRRLPVLSFDGKVTGVDHDSAQPLDVQVNYYPWWRCAFLVLADCGMGGEFVAAAPLAEDGTFAVRLPNYLHQEEIRAFERLHYRGEFEFHVRSRSTNRLLYRLLPGSVSGRVKERPAYHGRQNFQASRVK